MHTDDIIIDYQTAVDSNGRYDVYKTEQEAINAKELYFAKQRVEHAIESANDGWEPNWEDASQSKYCIYLSNKGLEAYAINLSKNQPNKMYIKSKELTNKLISENKKDLLLILSQ